MYESISKNNELENEMTLDISYFWYSAVVVIKCPSMKASDNNPSSHYSGHYCCHGLNVQAICDSSCRFTFFAMLHPQQYRNQEVSNLVQLAKMFAPQQLDLKTFQEQHIP